MKKTQKRMRGSGQDFWRDPILLAMVYEQCEFFWGCIPKVVGMLDVIDNGTQVPYTWRTIDLEAYEQYWPKEQDPIFDLNEDCEVVSPPRKVYGPYSTP
jgi:hypothetical protein